MDSKVVLALFLGFHYKSSALFTTFCILLLKKLSFSQKKKKNGTKSGIIWGDGIVSEFGMDVYTLLHLKWITSKDLLYSTGNSVQCYVAARMGEEFGGEWIHVPVWLSPFAVQLELSQQC